MKVIIAGSRSIIWYDIVEKVIDRTKFKITEFISGRAKDGVDALGERYAIEHGFTPRLFPADWDQYGKKAGMIRNQQMETYADAAIVIWDGFSPGSYDMVNRMRLTRKPVQLAIVQLPSEVLCAYKYRDRRYPVFR